MIWCVVIFMTRQGLVITQLILERVIMDTRESAVFFGFCASCAAAQAALMMASTASLVVLRIVVFTFSVSPLQVTVFSRHHHAYFPGTYGSGVPGRIGGSFLSDTM